MLKALDNAMLSWTPHAPVGEIAGGDTPGDPVRIGEGLIRNAGVLFPALLPLLRDALESGGGRAVVSVFGGSGVGKSGMASLLSFYLREIGIGAYTLSGDNYPRRIPMYNDAERLRIFRVHGVRGLLEKGLYSEEVRSALFSMWQAGTDPDPAAAEGSPWLSVYQQSGRLALAGYLGQDAELDFDGLRAVVESFRAGEKRIWLKRLGRTEDALWYSEVDFTGIQVLVIEWTHGGCGRFGKVDIPIFLAGTPAETLARRRARARDTGTDSAFTAMVLEIEQQLIDRQAPQASLILSKDGRLIPPDEYPQAAKAGR